MGYRIIKQSGDTVAVPQIVIARLSTARAEDLRVALCALAQGYADPAAVAGELGVSQQSVDLSFAYWIGAGLFAADGEITVKTPALPARAPRLTTREVVEYSKIDPNVSMLVSESQNLLGKTLSPTESAALVTLYAQDKLPIDMILTVMAHFTARGKRDVRYLEKILLSWREDGICNGVDAERYLAILEQRELREKEVAEVLGIDADGLTAGERTLVARWFEDFGFDRTMIEAAALRSGEKNNVRYLSGILKKWHAAGYKTPRDIPAEGANLQPTGRRGAAGNSVGTRSGARHKNGILLPQCDREDNV